MEIFISHASKDNKLGDLIVQLLLDIGVANNDITYTSKIGYGIPKGQNIFQWLKGKLTQKPFVIYLLSENYYSSIPCLNEMGAAWVIENDHIAVITPGFDISDKKFTEGAIDPREIVVFSDQEDDILEFVEIVLARSNIITSLSIINQAVKKYMTSLNILEDAITDVKTNYITIINRAYDEFVESVKNNKFIEEELLMIRYISDTGTTILGARWMTTQAIQAIEEWENRNSLNNKLSSHYQKVLSRFITREFVSVYSETSYGNPREYILENEISKIILFLNEDLKRITDGALEDNILTF